ncbi:MAG TPA: ATP-dependent zinc metalloprotease FtsH [Treponemataceae bacterium]|nr:ATP-dependent zinc metalloprotease FtsH [Treponemataceae bacterium]
MSDKNNNNDNKDDKDKNDPFNFFKLSNEPGKNDKGPGNFKKPNIPFWAILLVLGAVTLFINFFVTTTPSNIIEFSQFKQLIESGDIVSVELGSDYFMGYGPTNSVMDTGVSSRSLFATTTNSGRKEYKTAAILTEDFLKFLDLHGVGYKAIVPKNNYFLNFLLSWILPFGLIFLLWRMMFKKMGSGMGGGVFSAGSNKNIAVEEGKVTTRFKDVAGVDEAKEELEEVVNFLKSPKKYTDIGGKIPKGVLLVGPPGTGKTLLARAVAGEAEVPFFRISGSDFVEMFVGVGASRVRDLFKQARVKAPCIVFIDELDAIGKSRMSSVSGGNDEREQTLNQLLVEMDGFDGQTGLILLAATNRPDVLDPALLRPGRFDRQVSVDRPDIKGREAILKIHSKTVKMGSDVNLSSVAKTTVGFSGADLANIVNEAALHAVRSGNQLVSMDDFNEAVEKTIAGLQKKSRVINEHERRIVAYHETGHALTAAFTKGSDPVHKISIIPRGIGALGYTMQMPEDDRFLKTKGELIGEVDVLLGGRAAEELIFGEISTGASNDLQRATDIVRRMLTVYGMSDKFENVVLSKRGSGYARDEPQLMREYAESTQEYVDVQMAQILAERYKAVKKLLTEKKELLEYIAQRLLEKEVIDQKDFDEILTAQNQLKDVE